MYFIFYRWIPRRRPVTRAKNKLPDPILYFLKSGLRGAIGGRGDLKLFYMIFGYLKNIG
jgi:hypothetical protein